MKICLVAWLGMGLGSMLMGQAPASGNQELRLDLIQLPPGFQINVYARGVSGARSMTRGSEGTLFVGSRGDGAVYAVLDRDGDQQAEEVLTLVTELNTPNGVAFRDGDLYVAETHRVWRYRDIESHLEVPPSPSSSWITCPRIGVTVGDLLPLDPTVGYTFRLEHPVTPAGRQMSAMPPCCA